MELMVKRRLDGWSGWWPVAWFEPVGTGYRVEVRHAGRRFRFAVGAADVRRVSADV